METHRIFEVGTKELRPNPNQPRRTFDEEELILLRETLENGGQIEPLWVISKDVDDVPKNIKFKDGQNWLLVDGERRLRAFLSLGIKKISIWDMGCSYAEGYHKAVIKHKTTARHNDVEKARGIIEDLNNHLKGVDGFDKFKNGTVSLLYHIDNMRKRGDKWILNEDILVQMTTTINNVCASAGYTWQSVLREQIPLLNIKEDLERELGKVIEGEEDKKARLEEKRRLEEEVKKVEQERKKIEKERKQMEEERLKIEENRKMREKEERDLKEKAEKERRKKEKEELMEKAREAEKERKILEKEQEKIEEEKRKLEEEERRERKKSEQERERLEREEKKKEEERKRLEREAREKAVAKEGWKIPTSTLSRLNPISDANYRKKALDYVKKHTLGPGLTQKLSKIANSGYKDVFDAVISENISVDAGRLILQFDEEPWRKRLISELKGISNIEIIQEKINEKLKIKSGERGPDLKIRDKAGFLKKKFYDTWVEIKVIDADEILTYPPAIREPIIEHIKQMYDHLGETLVKLDKIQPVMDV